MAALLFMASEVDSPFGFAAGDGLPFCIGARMGTTIFGWPLGVPFGERGGYLTTFSRNGTEKYRAWTTELQ